MRKEITIGDKTVEFNASAATPLFYRRAFKSDMLVDLTSVNEDNPDIVLMSQCAYAMTKDCKEGKPFDEWLDQFDFMEFTNACADIFTLLADNSEQLKVNAPKETKNHKATER